LPAVSQALVAPVVPVHVAPCAVPATITISIKTVVLIILTLFTTLRMTFADAPTCFILFRVFILVSYRFDTIITHTTRGRHPLFGGGLQLRYKKEFLLALIRA
jgi:hypothetical protein